MVAAVLASVTLFAAQFGGQWKCGDVPWHIEQVAGTPWTTVRWGGDGPNGGVAYVGFIQARGLWIYEDFHGDGSLADPTSPGPTKDGWVWTGSYYAGDKTLGGKIVWKLSEDNSRIARTFFMRTPSGFTQTGQDVCARQ